MIQNMKQDTDKEGSDEATIAENPDVVCRAAAWAGRTS
jgi:hypothetical protein